MTARPRLGAYVLAADPTWLRSSLYGYYDRLDTLVISASATGRGWTGSPIASDACVALAESADHRGIARVVRGDWQNPTEPMRADTAQRNDAIAEVGDGVDWILQIDTDEVLPSIDALIRAIGRADELGLDAVEWPMSVLFRRLRDGRYLQVRSPAGHVHHEYPGPIAVRAGTRVVDARRTAGAFLRPTVATDTGSPQLAGPVDSHEIREPLLSDYEAIVHNSWAREPRVVRAKIAAWGHNRGARGQVYYYGTWLPAPYRWRRMREFHPLFPTLWPRLGVWDGEGDLLHPEDHT